MNLVIVGGGAAGFFAAITCAEQLRKAQAAPGWQVLTLEKATHPLGKVRISGGGRCNVTHACYDPAELASYYPRGGKALRAAFTRFQPSDTIAWFEQRGVRLKTEADGRIFPLSNTSQTIVDCLLEAARASGVVVQTGVTVTAVQAHPGEPAPFRVTAQAASSADLTHLPAHRLLIASGGDRRSLELPASLGHTIIPPVPSLFTFSIADARLEGLAGLSVGQVGLQLLDEQDKPVRQAGFEQAGALLVTHWGVSGPAVLRLSAWGARWLAERSYRAGLQVNWLYPMNGEQVRAALTTFRAGADHARQQVSAHAPFSRLPLRLWRRLVHAAGVGERTRWADLSKQSTQALLQELVAGRFAISGKGIFKDEFVTCGGVSLDEVDFKTMHSRVSPGLYLAGEVLDIDGLTGGFNFQSAWTTGWLAGTAMAQAALNQATG